MSLGRRTSWRPARCRRPFRPSPSTANRYWDGGIYSNTPIEVVLDDVPRRNSLIFSVNVWQPTGDASDDASSR